MCERSSQFLFSFPLSFSLTVSTRPGVFKKRWKCSVWVCSEHFVHLITLGLKTQQFSTPSNQYKLSETWCILMTLTNFLHSFFQRDSCRVDKDEDRQRETLRKLAYWWKVREMTLWKRFWKEIDVLFTKNRDPLCEFWSEMRMSLLIE
jgi:hypothetical protein